LRRCDASAFSFAAVAERWPGEFVYPDQAPRTCAAGDAIENALM
jgi:hypothetical protein